MYKVSPKVPFPKIIWNSLVLKRNSSTTLKKQLIMSGGMFWNYKTEFDFSELSSSSSHNKACDAWGPPCHATMYSSSLLLNIPTLIIIHLFLQSRRWIAFTRQTILNDFRKWHFVYDTHVHCIALYTYSSHYNNFEVFGSS